MINLRVKLINIKTLVAILRHKHTVAMLNIFVFTVVKPRWISNLKKTDVLAQYCLGELLKAEVFTVTKVGHNHVPIDNLSKHL